MNRERTTKILTAVALLTSALSLLIAIFFVGDSPPPDKPTTIAPLLFSPSQATDQTPPRVEVDPAAAFPEPEPEPEWFEFWFEGKLIYEGDVPYDDLPPFPVPIVPRANTNPTDAQLDAMVQGWLSVTVEPISVSDLVTYQDLKSATGWDDLYVVDGRFGIGVRYGPKEEITPEAQALVDQYADGHAMLSNVLHRAQYEFDHAFMARAFGMPRVQELDAQNRETRKELMQNHGVRIGATTLPVSEYTLRNLEG